MVAAAEEKWGKGVVEQVSLDMKAAFPDVKGFSARNLWFMKQWYTFYATTDGAAKIITDAEDGFEIGSEKLNQVGSVIQDQILNQPGSELLFPRMFAYVPWKHHILIIQRCKTIEEALFYIKRTIEEGLSRNALDNSIRADMYHAMGTAVTNFSDQLPDPQSILAQELLKENYDLGFISLPEKYDETALEEAIEQGIPGFFPSDA